MIEISTLVPDHSGLSRIEVERVMKEKPRPNNNYFGNTGKDIVLFYYYSSPSLPEECFLGLSNDISYRNMFLLSCGSKIHFEFPMFEDHSYNSICNLKGVKSLIKRPNEHEKYMIFRTMNRETNECNIIGYYKCGRIYYQETNMFNSNGFVWGIEADEKHLVKKGAIVFKEKIGRQYWTSWGNKENCRKLNKVLETIKREENISEKYKKETNRLVNLFKSKDKVDEWRRQCQYCGSRKECTLQRRFKRYDNKNPNSDMFSVIHRAYKENIYSRNELDRLPKEDIF